MFERILIKVFKNKLIIRNFWLVWFFQRVNGGLNDSHKSNYGILILYKLYDDNIIELYIALVYLKSTFSFQSTLMRIFFHRLDVQVGNFM